MNNSYIDNAKSYIAHEAQQELLARLPFLLLKPKMILETSEVEEMRDALQKMYPDSLLLNHNESIATASVDLIVANFFLPWCDDHQKIFLEWRRVLKSDGVILFNALGLDTLKEHQANLQAEIIPHFVDMHNIGDNLLQAGFFDPVLDVNYYYVKYHDGKKIIDELTASGMVTENILLSALSTLSVTYEVIQAHAFAPSIETTFTTEGITKIPLAVVKKQLQK